MWDKKELAILITLMDQFCFYIFVFKMAAGKVISSGGGDQQLIRILVAIIW